MTKILARHLILTCIIFDASLAQVVSTNELQVSDSSSMSILEVYVGVGFIPGQRLGIRARVHELFSAEVFYGVPAGTFFLGVSDHFRAGGAINIHIPKTPDLVASLILTTDWVPTRGAFYEKPFQWNYVSLTFGYVPAKKGRVQFFVRGGFAYEIINDAITKQIKHGYKSLDLDLGLSWTMF